MAITISAPDDEVFLIAVAVELDPDTMNRLRATFPGVSPELAIVGLVEWQMAEAAEINRKDGS